MTKRYYRVLTIAGSDSGGGAGIQADIKTISAMGCYAASAITAITVQNTLGVQAVHPVPLEILKGQIEAVLLDIGADAIKIGMLHSCNAINIIADTIEKYKISNVVLDPVMVSTSGHRLIEEKAIEVIKSKLIPLSRVITPNIPEAEILAGCLISGEQEFDKVARKLSDNGNVSVLLKAGHLDGEYLVDYFYNVENGTMTKLPSKRVQTKNTHGTGCTLSSAFAAALAKGEELTTAAKSAKRYIEQAIYAGAHQSIGNGFGPVNHNFNPQKMLINENK